MSNIEPLYTGIREGAKNVSFELPHSRLRFVRVRSADRADAGRELP